MQNKSHRNVKYTPEFIMGKFKQFKHRRKGFEKTVDKVQKQSSLNADSVKPPQLKPTTLAAYGKIHEVLVEELRCPVCYEVFNHAKSLTKCLHTFCQACLAKMITRKNKYIHCPLCRKKTPLPKRGVRFLPTNSVVLRLLDRFGDGIPKRTKANEGRVQNVASMCETSSTALKKISIRLDKDVRQLEKSLKQKERKFHKDVRNVVKRYKTQTKQRQKEIKRL